GRGDRGDDLRDGERRRARARARARGDPRRPLRADARDLLPRPARDGGGGPPGRAARLRRSAPERADRGGDDPLLQPEDAGTGVEDDAGEEALAVAVAEPRQVPAVMAVRGGGGLHLEGGDP